MSRGWLLSWAAGSVALGGASLVVPLYVVSLGGDPLALGLLASVAAFVGVPGALVFGRLADRTGHYRAFVLGALLIVSAMLVVIPLLPTIPSVIAANAAIWFAFAAGTPVVTLLAVSTVPETQWSTRIAELNKYQGVGWALGLLLGAIWGAVTVYTGGLAGGTEGLFYVLAGFGAIGIVLGSRYLPGPAKERSVSETKLRRAIRRADRFSVRAATFPFTVGRADFRSLHPGRLVDRFTPTLAVYFFAVTLFFLGFAAFFAPLPAFLTDSGFADDQIFALYLISSIAAAAFFGGAGAIAARIDVAVFQTVGLGIRGVAMPAVAVGVLALGSATTGFVLTAAIFAVIGFTWAVIAVTAGTIVTQLSPVALRGEALGMYAALGAFAGGIGSILGGRLGNESYLLAFGAAGGFVLLGAGLVIVLRQWRTDQPSEKSTDSEGTVGTGSMDAE